MSGAQHERLSIGKGTIGNGAEVRFALHAKEKDWVMTLRRRIIGMLVSGCERAYYAVADREARSDYWADRSDAEKGDAMAQFFLGFSYQFGGGGVFRDNVEAARWYRMAAEQGLDMAQESLGDMYLSGNGVPQNVSEAVHWYRMAAEQGHAMAQCSLGNMYLSGNGVAQDASEAARLYRLAAEQGNAKAQFSLGKMYRSGHGVPENGREAARWYRMAAEQEFGKEGFFQVVRSFHTMAEHGHAEAQFALGSLYAEGRGVSQDKVQAYAWYSITADRGNANAKELKERVATSMTGTQAATAQNLASEYWEAYVVPFQ